MKLTCRIMGFVAIVLAAACGSEDGGKAGAGDDRAGAGGKGGSDAGVDAGDGKTIECGSTTCRAPEGSPFEVCCKDQFAGACGLVMGEGQCMQMRAEVVTSCPLPDIPGIADATAGSGAQAGVSGCCTPNNECGVDLGVGTGCSSNSSLCTFFPFEYASKLQLITCDGKELETKPSACTDPPPDAGASTE